MASFKTLCAILVLFSSILLTLAQTVPAVQKRDVFDSQDFVLDAQGPAILRRDVNIQGSAPLIVTGTVSLAGSVTVNGLAQIDALSINGDITTPALSSGYVQILGDSTLSGNVLLGGTSSPAVIGGAPASTPGDLTLSGQDAASVGGDLYLVSGRGGQTNGTINLSAAQVTLDSESINFNGLSAESATINGTLNAQDINAGNLNADQIIVSQSSSFDGVSAQNFTSTSNVAASNTNAVSVEASGDASFGSLYAPEGVVFGSLSVFGTSSVEDIIVSNNVQVSESEYVAGSLSINGLLGAASLSVTGDSTLSGDILQLGSDLGLSINRPAAAAGSAGTSTELFGQSALCEGGPAGPLTINAGSNLNGATSGGSVNINAGSGPSNGNVSIGATSSRVINIGNLEGNITFGSSLEITSQDLLANSINVGQAGSPFEITRDGNLAFTSSDANITLNAESGVVNINGNTIVGSNASDARTVVNGDLSVEGNFNLSSGNLEASSLSVNGGITTENLNISGRTAISGNIILESGSTFYLSRPIAASDATSTTFVGQDSVNGTGGNLNINSGTGNLTLEAGFGSEDGSVLIGARSGNVNINSATGTRVQGDASVAGTTSVSRSITLGSRTDMLVSRTPSESDGYDTYIIAQNAAASSNLELAGGVGGAGGFGSVVIGQDSAKVVLGNNFNASATVVINGPANFEETVEVGDNLGMTGNLAVNGANLVVGNAYSEFFVSRSSNNNGDGSETNITGQAASVVGGDVNFYAGAAGTSGKGGDITVDGSTINATAYTSIVVDSESNVNIARNNGIANLTATEIAGSLVSRQTTTLNSNVSVAGDVEVTGLSTEHTVNPLELSVRRTLSVDSRVIVGGTTTFGGAVTATIWTNVTGDLNVAGATELSADLSVSGKEFIHGSVEVIQDFNVAGDVSARNGAEVDLLLSVAGSSTLKNVASGDLEADSLTADDVYADDLSNTGSINSGSISVYELNGDSLNTNSTVVYYDSVLRGPSTVSGNAAVTGKTALASLTLSEQLESQTVEAAAADVDSLNIADKLSAGSVTVGSLNASDASFNDLEISSSASINSLNVDGYAKTGAVDVSGSLTAGSLVANGAATFSGDLLVRTDAQLGVVEAIDASINGSAVVTGELYATGALSVSRDQYVGGYATIQNNLTSEELSVGSANIGSVNAQALTSADIVISGSTSTANFAAYDAKINNDVQSENLYVALDTDVNNLRVSGNSNLESSLFVEGTFNISGDATISQATYLNNVIVNNPGNFEIIQTTSNPTTISGQSGVLTGGNLAFSAGTGSDSLGNIILNAASDIIIEGGSGNHGGSVYLLADDSVLVETANCVDIGAETAEAVIIGNSNSTTNIDAPLYVSGDVYVATGINAQGSSDFTGSLNVSGSLNSGSLTASGSAEIRQLLATAVTVDGQFTSGDVSVGNQASFDSVNVESIAARNSISADSLSVGGSVITKGDASVNGDNSIEGSLHIGQFLITDALSVSHYALLNEVNSGSGTFLVGPGETNANIHGDLSVSGSLAYSGSVTSGGDVRGQDINASTNTSIAGDLSSSGNVVVGDLSVSNNAFFDDSLASGSFSVEQDFITEELTTSGVSNFNQSLTVGGTVSAASLNVASSTNAGEVLAQGDISVSGITAVGASLVADTISASNSQVGNLSYTNTLSVSSNANFSGDAQVLNTVSVGGSLINGQNIIISNSLSVDGSFNTEDFAVAEFARFSEDVNIVTKSDIKGELSVSGDVASGVVSVYGSQVISGSFAASNVEVLNEFAPGSLSLSAGAVVEGDLKVHNDVSLSGSANIGSSLAVGLDSSISGSLSVSRSLLTEDLSISGTSSLTNVNIKGRTFADSDLSVSGQTTVGGDFVATGRNSISADTVTSQFLTLQGSLSAPTVSVLSKTYLSDLSVGDSVSVGCQGAVFDSTLTVSSQLSSASDVYISDNQNVNGNLNVLGNLETEFLNITGSSSLDVLYVTYDSTSEGGLVVGSSLSVSGRIEATNYSTGSASAESASVFGSAQLGSLAVSGNSLFIGDIDTTGNVFAASDAYFTESVSAGNLSVSGTASTTTSYVTGDEIIEGDLTVFGNVKFGSDNNVFIGDTTLNVVRATTLGASILVSQTSELTNLTVTGTTTFAENVDAESLRSGNLNIAGTDRAQSANLNGLTVGDTASFGDLSVVGSANFLGSVYGKQDASINGSLNILGDLSTAANTVVSATSFTASSTANSQAVVVMSNAAVGGDLSVAAESTFGCSNISVGQEFNIAKDATFSQDLSVAGNAAISQNLAIRGDLTACCSGNGNFTEDVTLGALGARLGTIVSTIDSLSLTISGNTQASSFSSQSSSYLATLSAGSLTVDGDSSVNSDISINGDGTFSRRLYLGEDLNVTDDVNVGQNTYASNIGLLNNASIENMLSTQNLDVSSVMQVAESVEVQTTFVTQNLIANVISAGSIITDTIDSQESNLRNIVASGLSQVSGPTQASGLNANLATILGQLNVNGTTVADELSVQEYSTSGNFESAGQFNAGGSGSFANLNVNGRILSDSLTSNSSNIQSLSVDQNTNIDGQTNIQGSLVVGAYGISVDGIISASSDAVFQSDLSIAGGLDAAAINAGTLNIATDGFFSTASTVAGDAIISGPNAVSGNLTSESLETGDIVAGSLTINGDTTLSGDVSVVGDSVFGCSGAEIQGGLSVAGAASFSSASVNGDASIGGPINIAQSAQFSGGVLSSESLQVAGSVEVNRNFVANGSSLVNGNLQGGAVNVLGGNVEITDSASVDTLEVNTAWTVINLSAVSGTFAGSVSASSVSSSGDSNLAGPVTVSGSLVISGDASVSGQLSASTLSAAGNAFATSLELSQNIQAGNAVANSFSAGSISADSVRTYYMEVTQDVTLNSLNVQEDLTVGGSASIASVVSTTHDFSVDGFIIVDGDSTIGRDLTVSGNIGVAESLQVFGSVVAGESISVRDFNLNLNGLQVEGRLEADRLTAIATEFGSLTVSGISTVQSAYVDGAIDVRKVNAAGDLSVSTDLTVLGLSSLQSMNVENLILSGDLNVEGAVEVQNNASFNERVKADILMITGALSAEDLKNTGTFTYIPATLTVQGDSFLGPLVNLNNVYNGNGSAIVQNDFSSESLSGSTLNVAGTANLGDVTAESSNLTSATVSGDLIVSGPLQSSSIVASQVSYEDVSVSGQLAADNVNAVGINIAGDLTVSSDANYTSNLNIQSALFVQNEAEISGGVTAAGPFVGGSVSIQNNLQVTDLYVQGDVSIQTINVLGNGSRTALGFNALTDIVTTTGLAIANKYYNTGDLNIGGDISVNGDTDLGCNGAVDAQSITVFSSASFESDLNADSVSLGGDLDVEGSTSTTLFEVSSGETEVANINSGNLFVFSSATFEQNVNALTASAVQIDVKGLISAATMEYADGAQFNDLSVTSDFVLTDGALDVSRNVNFGNSLTSNDLSVGSRANVGGDVIVGGSLILGTDLSVLGTVMAADLGISGQLSTTDLSVSTAGFNSLSVSRNATFESTLRVTGNARVNDQLRVDDDSIFNGEVSVACYELSVSGSLNLADNLAVVGNLTDLSDATVSGVLTASNTIFVAGDSITSSIDVDGEAQFGEQVTIEQTLLVNGSTSLNGNSIDFMNGFRSRSSSEITGTVNVTQSSFIFSTLTVAGDASLGADAVATDFSVSGNLSVAGATSLDSNLNVGGFGSVNGDLQVQQGTFIGGEIQVVQNSILDSTASVAEDLSIAGSLSSAGSLSAGTLSVFAFESVNGDLTVGGNAIFQTQISAAYLSVGATIATVGDVAVNGDANVDGSVTLYGALNAGTATIFGQQLLSGDLTGSNNLFVTGTVQSDGDLVAAGLANFGEFLNVDGSAAVSAFIIVVGDTTVDGNLANLGTLTVTGEFTSGGSTFIANDLTVLGSATIGSTLSIGGDVLDTETVKAFGSGLVGGNLNVMFSATVGQALFVAGDSTFGGLESGGDGTFAGLIAAGDLTSPAQLTVAGNVFIGDDLSVFGDGTVGAQLFVVDDVSIARDLSVNGEATIDGSLTVASSAFYNGDVIVDGIASLQGSLELFNELSVEGTTLIGNDLTVDGNSSVAGSYFISGDATFNMAFTAGPGQINGNIVSGPGSTMMGMMGRRTISLKAITDTTVGADLRANDTDVGSLIVDGPTSDYTDLTIVGQTVFSGNLEIDNSTSIDGDVFVLDIAYFRTNFATSGDFEGNADLSVQDTASLAKNLIVRANAEIGNDLTVYGATFFGTIVSNSSILSVGDLSVMNANILEDVSVAGETSLNQGSIVNFANISGQANLTSLNTSSLTVVSDADFGGDISFTEDLSVQGTTYADSLIVSGSVSGTTVANAVAQDLTIEGDLTLNNVTASDLVSDDTTTMLLSFPYNGTSDISSNGERTPNPNITEAYPLFVINFAPESDTPTTLYALTLSGYTLNFLEPGMLAPLVYRFETINIAFSGSGNQIVGTQTYRYEVGDVIFVKGPSDPTKLVMILDYQDVIQSGSGTPGQRDGNIYNGRSMVTQAINIFSEILNSDEVVMYMYTPRTSVGNIDGTTFEQDGPVEWVKVQ